MVFEELDQSGGKADRPLFLEAVARQEAGQAQILCVAKLDRFGRSLIDGLAAIERVTTAGGNVVSVADGLDFQSDTGRLVLRLMLSLAEWELDRVRTTWAVAQERAIRRGVHMGSVPLGYKRRKDGRLVVDRARASAVAELFERRAAGESMRVLASDLTAQGIPTYHGGREWAPETVRAMVRRRVYLGEVRHGSYVNVQAHEPLVDAATWQSAQAPRRGPRRSRRPEPALLHGLLRCASCSRLLTTKMDARGTSQERIVYHCFGRSSQGRCPRPVAISDLMVEPYVEAVMWGLLARGSHETAQEHVIAARHEVETRGDQLTAYRDDPRWLATLGPQRFEAGLRRRVQREERALLALAAARAAVASMPPDVEKLRHRWPSMGLADRREVIASAIDTGFVSHGHGAPERRVWAMRGGSAPLDLVPAAPHVMPALAPFDSKGQARAVPAAGTLDWSRRKSVRALEEFLRERGSWPRFSEFQAAGLGLAYANLRRHGTVQVWAREFGITYESRQQAMSAWSAERVRDELPKALKGWQRWPTQEEFAAMGQSTLRQAAATFGSPQEWASECGVTLSPRQRRRWDRWTPQRIEGALVELCAGQTTWPTKRQFERADALGLYEAINRAGTRRQLAAKLGLEGPTGEGYYRVPDRWTIAAVEEALGPLLAGRAVWPRGDEFRALGLGGLYQVIAKRPGGHDACARAHGMTRERWHNARKPGH